MRPELAHWLLEVGSWSIAFAWCYKVTDALRHMGEVADITGVEWDLEPVDGPALTVVVPARDEAGNIGQTLAALLKADYPKLHIIAVDDRSTDETGAIVDEYARRNPERITAVHITELPYGWLGKTHAMEQAVRLAQDAKYVLFTDADVLFSPSILRRSVAYAEAVQADHLVTLPTMEVRSKGEGIVLGFFQIFGLWASRPWKVADPAARRDTIGVGAFNLVRREALLELGGLAPQRLAVLEDITLGRRMKAAHKRQFVAFAPGLVLVHWAKGVNGLMRVMSKNLFSAFNFRPVLTGLACLWIVVFCIAPIAGIFYWRTLAPGLLVAAAVSVAYRIYGAISRIDARYGWAFPVGAVAFLYAIARSIFVVWKDRGVRWRGTLYPLAELRRHNSPLMLKGAGARRRD